MRDIKKRCDEAIARINAMTDDEFEAALRKAGFTDEELVRRETPLTDEELCNVRN